MSGPLRISIALLLSMLIVILPWWVIGELPGERWLSYTDDNALLFALMGSGLLSLDVLLPIPSSLVLTSLGGRLGLGWGVFWSWLGLMGSCLLGYGCGRLYPRRFGESLARDPTLALLFLSRPVPVLAEVGALTAGACRTALLPFLIACGLGNAVYASVLCASAALLLPGDWSLLALALPMLVPVAGWLLWRRLGKG